MKNHASELFEEAKPGEVLQKTREERGLEMDEVAVQLNLTVERVRQIEQQQWQLLPGLTFARGYLRQYARLLELDADALVEQFNQLTDSFSEPQAQAQMLRIEPPRQSFLSLRLISLILLIVLAIASFLWWEGHRGPAKETQTTQAIDWSQELEGSTDTLLEDEPPLPPPAAEPSPVAEDNADKSTDEAAVASRPAAPAGDETAQQNQVAQPPVDNVTSAPAPPAEGVLDFDFADDCWLQVKDGMGKVLFSGILSASDTLQYNGDPVLITAATSRLTFGSEHE